MAVDRKFKITQNDINKTFDQLKSLKKFDQMIKYKTFIIKTFDQLKNDNFDQVKFDQVSVSHFRPTSFLSLKIIVSFRRFFDFSLI